MQAVNVKNGKKSSIGSAGGTALSSSSAHNVSSGSGSGSGSKLVGRNQRSNSFSFSNGTASALPRRSLISRTHARFSSGGKVAPAEDSEDDDILISSDEDRHSKRILSKGQPQSQSQYESELEGDDELEDYDHSDIDDDMAAGPAALPRASSKSLRSTVGAGASSITAAQHRPKKLASYSKENFAKLQDNHKLKTSLLLSNHRRSSITSTTSNDNDNDNSQTPQEDDSTERKRSQRRSSVKKPPSLRQQRKNSILQSLAALDIDDDDEDLPYGSFRLDNPQTDAIADLDTHQDQPSPVTLPLHVQSQSQTSHKQGENQHQQPPLPPTFSSLPHRATKATISRRDSDAQVEHPPKTTRRYSRRGGVTAHHMKSDDSNIQPIAPNVSNGDDSDYGSDFTPGRRRSSASSSRYLRRGSVTKHRLYPEIGAMQPIAVSAGDESDYGSDYDFASSSNYNNANDNISITSFDSNETDGNLTNTPNGAMKRGRRQQYLRRGSVTKYFLDDNNKTAVQPDKQTEQAHQDARSQARARLPPPPSNEIVISPQVFEDRKKSESSTNQTTSESNSPTHSATGVARAHPASPPSFEIDVDLDFYSTNLEDSKRPSSRRSIHVDSDDDEDSDMESDSGNNADKVSTPKKTVQKEKEETHARIAANAGSETPSSKSKRKLMRPPSGSKVNKVPDEGGKNDLSRTKKRSSKDIKPVAEATLNNAMEGRNLSDHNIGGSRDGFLRTSSSNTVPTKSLSTGRSMVLIKGFGQEKPKKLLEDDSGHIKKSWYKEPKPKAANNSASSKTNSPKQNYQDSYSSMESSENSEAEFGSDPLPQSSSRISSTSRKPAPPKLPPGSSSSSSVSGIGPSLKSRKAKAILSPNTPPSPIASDLTAHKTTISGPSSLPPRVEESFSISSSSHQEDRHRSNRHASRSSASAALGSSTTSVAAAAKAIAVVESGRRSSLPATKQKQATPKVKGLGKVKKSKSLEPNSTPLIPLKKSCLKSSSTVSSSGSSNTATTVSSSSTWGDFLSAGPKSVRFGNLVITEFPIILGDNPAVTSGAPVTIDWSPQDERRLSVNAYEQSKPRRRRRRKLLISVSQRAILLLAAGYSIDDIADASINAQQIKQSRQQAIDNQSWDRLNLMMEHTGDALGRGIGFLHQPLQTTGKKLKALIVKPTQQTQSARTA